MAYVVEKSGKSVGEAIRLALEELQCDRQDVEMEVVAEPTKGIFGIFGSKDAKVRVWKKEDAADFDADAEVVQDDVAQVIPYDTSGETVAEEDEPEGREASDEDDKTAKFILDVTEYMGIKASIGRREEEETVFYSLNGQRMGTVIGRRGETLDALQYLTNIVAGKEKDVPRKRVVIDAEDYRQRREDTLIRLATRLAAKAKKSGRRVVLEPMNPQERRVIHTALEEDPGVRSISEGEDPYRRLVIYPVIGEYRNERNNRNNTNQRYESDSNSDDRDDRYDVYDEDED